MSKSILRQHITDFYPKQPEFVLVTSDYVKRVLLDHKLAHFYQFKAESSRMSVIPDACIDILFWKKDGKIKSIIAGSFLLKGYANLEIGCDYFGVRFMPGINPANSIVKVSELLNNELNFEDMIHSSSVRERLNENMQSAETFDEKIKAFTDYYSDLCGNFIEDKNTLKYALQNKIYTMNGNIKLSELGDYTGYSERYLNKKIHEYFGMNPKNLIRIIRFQNTIRNLTETITNLAYVDTALMSGYYDQPHFNKEFKNFTGLTPSSYIQNLLTNSYIEKLHIT